MVHIGVGEWVQFFVYAQYMGHTLSNILVKYVREYNGDICPIYEQYYGHISSIVLAIYWQYLQFLRGKEREESMREHVAELHRIRSRWWDNNKNKKQREEEPEDPDTA